MLFRKAKENEKDNILNLYNKDRDSDFTAWNDEYPTIDNINYDLIHDNLFVLVENDEIIGSIAINGENELDNEATFSNSKALEFGRVIINPVYRGKGYSNILLHCIENEIKSRGYNSVHICVYVNSPIALNLYKHNGYKEITKKELFGNDFIIFEKNL